MPAHRFSASSSALASHCLYSFRPDVPRAPYRSRRDGIVGTAIHFALAHTIKTGDTECAYEEPNHPDKILSDDEAETVRVVHETWVREWYRHHSSEKWESELAIGVDPTARVATVVPTPGGHRDYSALGESFVPGTADLVRYDAANRTVYLKDFKSSNVWDLAARPAAENKQLATLAVAFATYYGATRAVVSLDLVRTSRVTIDEAELTALDLAEHREWLAERLRLLPTAEPADGPHCRALFCSHYGVCPATVGKLAEVEPTATMVLPSAVDRVRLPIVSDPNAITSAEHARYQYETLRAAQAAIDSRMAACWDATRQWADANGGIQLGTMTWRRVTHPRESIDLTVTGATNALEHVLGADRWRDAVEMSTSKKAIEAAVRPIAVERSALGEKVTIKGMKDSVLKALKSVGAVRTSERVAYEEVESASAETTPALAVPSGSRVPFR